MAKHRSNIIFRRLVMVLLLTYAFYALSNLFFIPNCVSASPYVSARIGTRRQRVQANNSAVSIILIAERPILNDNKASIIKFMPAILLIFYALTFFLVDAECLNFRLKLLLQRRYDYLSFCMLRI
jgi:hypothetical protein